MDPVGKAATGQDALIPRSFLFGPKVGAYIRNLQGDSTFTTIDVWEARHARSYFKGLFDSGDFGLPTGASETELFVKWGNKVSEQLGLSSSGGQAARWFYIIGKIGEAGYSKAVINDTISGYLKAAIAQRSGLGEGGAETQAVGQDAEPQRDGGGVPGGRRGGRKGNGPARRKRVGAAPAEEEGLLDRGKKSADRLLKEGGDDFSSRTGPTTLYRVGIPVVIPAGTWNAGSAATAALLGQAIVKVTAPTKTTARAWLIWRILTHFCCLEPGDFD